MKRDVITKGIILSGKAWEIKQQLKEAQHQYTYVNDWIADVQEQELASRKRSI